jgi:hypothetical protein
MYVYYASMLRCWHLVWILVRTDHPCLGVGCHIQPHLCPFQLPPSRDDLARGWHTPPGDDLQG